MPVRGGSAGGSVADNLHVRRDWLQVRLSESSDLDALYDELRTAGPLPDVPLIVLTGTAVDDFKRAVSAGVPEQALLGELDGKRRLYNELAKSVPRGENRLIEGVGHVTLPLRRRTDTGAQAVRDVLALGSR
ncbi:hypothetical protein AB0451_35725 [Streptomyces sp. NPDC052000]|uniref:hypothetical protein n=1 Tax=Streptomyces sp. NPDC052000 TaxID=3155676 RepID=UPI0034509CA0